MTAVLDASAVLALINSEPGWEVASEYLDDAVISTVNLSEVVGKLSQIEIPAAVTRSIIDMLALRIVVFDEQQAVDAGSIVPQTRKRGLGLGDRCCLALARSLNSTAVTADRAWRDVDVGVEVRAIRP